MEEERKKEIISHHYEDLTARLEEKKEEGFEFVFGKYWLNRLGVILFVLGIAFFIGYSFKYLNAFAKISLGYLFSISFFVWGKFLERDRRYTRITWGILGGAWGLLYLSTYAMYYVETTKIISSPVLELWLLALVSFSAILYNLRYRSSTVTSLTFLFAYFTAGLGDIEYSTLIYWLILTASIIFLSYKLNWYKFLLFGICGNYITYMFWLYPRIFSSLLVTKSFTIPIYQFQLSFGVLLIAWLGFTLILFLLKADDKEKLNYLILANILNIGFFAFLGLIEIYRIEPILTLSWDIKFWFIFILAIFYFLAAFLHNVIEIPQLIVVDISIAFSLIGMAIILKFPRLSVSFFWVLEMLILFIIGIYYKEIAYRVLAGILGVCIFLRLLFVDYFSDKYYRILGIELKHNIVIFIFTSLCFYFIGRLMREKIIERLLGLDKISSEEKDVFSFFIVLATILLTFLFAKEIRPKWLSLMWALEGISILGAGFLLKDKIYRICALCVLSLACLRVVFVDIIGMNTIYKIITFVFLGLILLIASVIYSKYMSAEK